MIRSTIEVIPDSQHRFSEKCFRRYEPDLIEVCRLYPKAVTIFPRNIVAETYRARVKDVMRAYVCSTWTSPVDKNKINFILHNFVITIHNHAVVIGPNDPAQLRPIDSSVKAVDERETIKIQIDTFDPEELEAALLLAERGKLPIEIELHGMTEALAGEIETKRPNLSIGERDGKFYLI
jgi:hypothetical protein